MSVKTVVRVCMAPHTIKAYDKWQWRDFWSIKSCWSPRCPRPRHGIWGPNHISDICIGMPLPDAANQNINGTNIFFNFSLVPIMQHQTFHYGAQWYLQLATGFEQRIEIYNFYMGQLKLNHQTSPSCNFYDIAENFQNQILNVSVKTFNIIH